MSFTNDPALQTNQLPISIEFPADPELFREILSLWQQRVSNSVNSKTGGLFTLVETFNSEQFFTAGNPNVFRNDYRKTFDITGLNGGNIAGGATVNFPHGITGLLQGTLIYATCTAVSGITFTVTYPYFTVDTATGGNINFTNPLGATALSTVIGVAEYVKN